MRTIQELIAHKLINDHKSTIIFAIRRRPLQSTNIYVFQTVHIIYGTN